jgi:hypothetical protein
MILKEYVEAFLKESLKISDIPKIDMIIKKLNEESLELLNKLTERGDEEDYDHYIFGYLDNVAYKNKPRLEEIGEGQHRSVYNIPGEDWVLKIAIDNAGSIINKQEVEISQGMHGLAARDIFLKVYDYDKISKNTKWIISQKVIAVEDVTDIEILKKVFPTIWNAVKSNNRLQTNQEYLLDEFISILGVTMTNFTEYLDADKSLPKELFYKAIKSCFPSSLIDSSIVPYEEFKTYKDFDRINQAYAYVKAIDLHEGNFGLIDLENPSPDSIVILDFDIN